MTTKARTGAGTKLQLGDGASPEVFNTIVEVLTLSAEDGKIDMVEVTNQDSPADANHNIYKERIAALFDGGSVDFTANLVKGTNGYATLRGARDGKPHNWKITGPPDYEASPVAPLFTWSFSAFVTDLKREHPLDKQMTISGKLQITGPDTFE